MSFLKKIKESAKFPSRASTISSPSSSSKALPPDGTPNAPHSPLVSHANKSPVHTSAPGQQPQVHGHAAQSAAAAVGSPQQHGKASRASMPPAVASGPTLVVNPPTHSDASSAAAHHPPSAHNGAGSAAKAASAGAAGDAPTSASTPTAAPRPSKDAGSGQQPAVSKPATKPLASDGPVTQSQSQASASLGTTHDTKPRSPSTSAAAAATAAKAAPHPSAAQQTAQPAQVGAAAPSQLAASHGSASRASATSQSTARQSLSSSSTSATRPTNSVGAAPQSLSSSMNAGGRPPGASATNETNPQRPQHESKAVHDSAPHQAGSAAHDSHKQHAQPPPSHPQLQTKPPAPSQSSEVAVPRKRFTLQDIAIERTLGTGSFGRVHLVRLKGNNKFYAMKVLRKNEIVKMRQVEHTINEKHILELLDFPFLVSMLGTFQDSANVYFILEYIQGGELFSYLRRCVRFPNHVARFYAAEVVMAFEYLHSKEIIYRDLKPEAECAMAENDQQNLLITAQGHIKITDFGFAKIVHDVTWTLCGTPDYLAPEIIQSKGYGRAVDWWALGILIYEMVAGYPPFYHEEHMKLYENILACKPKFPQNFDPHCKDLVKRLLSADLTKRFGNLKGGVLDIKRHKWFAGVDWEKLQALEIPAPYIPPLKGDGDTSNFDSYPEDYEPYGATGPDPHRDKFKDF